ncbi:MAG: VCBS repeat-containing protein, partial [bacterium]|nr:VCBS repeat-containing protein [bacterium]
MKKIINCLFIILILLLFSLTCSFSQPWTSLNFDSWRVQQSSLAWGDINNDGWLDIVISGNDIDTPAERTRVLINNRDTATFTMNQELTYGFYAGSVNLVDYDNDGDLDLCINGSVPGAGSVDVCRLRIYKNQGNGTFDTSFVEPVPGWGTWYGNVEWNDYDNDGDMDFAVCGDDDGSGISSGRSMRVYQNQGNGTFLLQLNVSANGYLEYGCLSWGDFNNDGYNDLVVGGINGVANGPSYDTFKLQLYRNNGDGTFNNTPVDVDTSTSPALGYKRLSIATGDFDNDGDIDFAVTGHSSISTVLRFRMNLNQGGYSFSTSDIAGAAFGVVGGSLAAGDYDLDGNLDLALIGYDGTAKRFYLYSGNGNGTFDSAVEPDSGWGIGDDNFTPPTEYGYTGSSMAFGDFDNDGNLDLAMTGRDSGSLPRFRIYRNDMATHNAAPGSPVSLQCVNNGGYWRLQWTTGGDDHTPINLRRYNVSFGTNISGSYTSASTNIYYPRGQARVGNVRSGATYYDTKIPWANGKQIYWKACGVDTSFKISPYTAEQTVLPVWVSSTASDTNQIDLVWRRYNINNATGYTLYRNTSKTP